MKREDINIRDPYVLLTNGTYYLYGTRSATTWGPADGLDCYVSQDLETYEGPIEIYHKEPDSPFVCCYWAPECYELFGKYYLITTLGKEGNQTGIYALTADKPEGPYVRHENSHLTPDAWRCIDGTLYQDDTGLYLAFSRSFEDAPDGGDLWAVKLDTTGDRINGPEGEPFMLFSAAECGWNEPIPFAKDFGIDEDVYLSDGPSLFQTSDGALTLLWSSWYHGSYAVGAAVSASGDIHGPWTHYETPVWPENAGHGMVFTKKDGTLCYALHYPNDKYMERPVFHTLAFENGKVTIRA